MTGSLTLAVLHASTLIAYSDYFWPHYEPFSLFPAHAPRAYPVDGARFVREIVFNGWGLPYYGEYWSGFL